VTPVVEASVSKDVASSHGAAANEPVANVWVTTARTIVRPDDAVLAPGSLTDMIWPLVTVNGAALPITVPLVQKGVREMVLLVVCAMALAAPVALTNAPLPSRPLGTLVRPIIDQVGDVDATEAGGEVPAGGGGERG